MKPQAMLLAGAAALVTCLAASAQAPAPVVQPGSDSPPKTITSQRSTTRATDVHEAMGVVSAADFVRRAAMGSQAQIEIGRVAQANAGSPAVRDLAARIIRTHQTSKRSLIATAATQGLEAPEGIDDEAAAVKRHLQNLRGIDSDRAYLDFLAAHHDYSIDLFERATRLNNDDLRSYAQRQLPRMHDHASHAQRLAEVELDY